MLNFFYLVQGTLVTPCTEYEIDISASDNGYYARSPRAIALDCEMVGGESDGSLDLCARVCLIDEDENLIFHTYVRPETPVTNYRYPWTALLLVPVYFRSLCLKGLIITSLIAYSVEISCPGTKSLV